MPASSAGKMRRNEEVEELNALNDHDIGFTCTQAFGTGRLVFR
jgi:hypothetical protein